jgi:hypothetical protein
MVIIPIYKLLHQGKAMITASYHHTEPLFTLANQPETLKIGKRLVNIWPQVFRDQVFPSLPVDAVASTYCKDNGAPTKNLNTMLGLLFIQELMDLTDQQTIDALAFDKRIQYALHVDNAVDNKVYISLRNYKYFKERVAKLDLVKTMLDNATMSLAEANNVDTSNLRMDSVHIYSNMKSLSRGGIFNAGISRFFQKARGEQQRCFQAAGL